MNRRDYLAHYLTTVDGSKPSDKLPKHVKMASNPFVFFRGSSQLFYADIKNKILRLPEAFEQVPNTLIMGDCHLSNFGFFTEEGSHGDHVIFAPNDFDDACVGPAIWDISRYLISLILAADYGYSLVNNEEIPNNKYLGKRVVSKEQVKEAMTQFIDAYIDTCQQSIQSIEVLATALDSFKEDHLLSKLHKKAVCRSAGGDEFTTKSRLAKAVQWSEKEIAFKADQEKFATLPDSLYQDIKKAFAPYVDDDIVDIVARKGAGTGSLNLSRYYLLVGPKIFGGETELSLYHIVEIKQQRKAAPLYHFKELSEVNRLNPAHLTINCQRRMQRSPDLVLDEVNWQDAYWLVRSRHHAKVGVDPEDVVIGKKATQKNGYIQFAQSCGKALALGHCRGDRRSTRFEAAIANTLFLHKKEVISACLDYALQVNADTDILKQLLTSK